MPYTERIRAWLFSDFSLPRVFVWRIYISVVVTSLRFFTPNELTSRRFRIGYYLVVTRRLRRFRAVFSLGLSPFPSRHSSWPGFHISSEAFGELSNLPSGRDAVIAFRNFDSTLAYFLSSLRSRSFFHCLLHLRLHLPFLWSFSFLRFLLAMFAAIATPPSRGGVPRDIAAVVIQGEGAVIASFRRLRTFHHASILLYPTSFSWLFPSTFILLVAPTL